MEEGKLGKEKLLMWIYLRVSKMECEYAWRDKVICPLMGKAYLEICWFRWMYM
jgi:hypothetical protein